MNRYLFSAASLLALAAGMAPAYAQDDEVTVLERITVTANRTPTEDSKVGSKVERISEEDIGATSLPAVIDYITRLPGVAISNAGGYGGTASVRVRGLGDRYVKTLYNGIDISDASGTQVQTPYEHLMIGGISGIEVLKGSQSTLYGSNAIAGVVDISTASELVEGVRHTVEAEGGSFNTFRGRYGFAGASGGSRVSANIAGINTDGISAAAGQPENDPYRNVTVDMNIEHRINEAFSVFGSVLHIDARADFDNSDGTDNLFNRNLVKMTGARAGFNLDLMDGRMKNTFSMQAFGIDRTVLPGNDLYKGRRHKFDYQGSFAVNDRVLLQYGADHERQGADITTAWSTLNRTHDLTGVWAQAIVEPVDDLVLTAGLRHDTHSEFGGHTTYRGTASYNFADTGTRLHASAGTGFRAPSLNELYGPFGGNPSLRPETSVSFDVGVEQTLIDGLLTADLTYFNLAVDNLIDYFGAGYTQIAGTTRSQGVEASLTYAAAHWLDLGGSYTYTDSRTPTGEQAARVPRHALTLFANARPAEKWTVSADLKYVSNATDLDFATWPATTAKLQDHVLVNAKVAYQLSDTTEVYVRGENLLNQRYQTVLNYGTPGIAAFAGIKSTF